MAMTERCVLADRTNVPIEGKVPSHEDSILKRCHFDDDDDECGTKVATPPVEASRDPPSTPHKVRKATEAYLAPVDDERARDDDDGDDANLGVAEQVHKCAVELNKLWCRVVAAPPLSSEGCILSEVEQSFVGLIPAGFLRRPPQMDPPPLPVPAQAARRVPDRGLRSPPGLLTRTPPPRGQAACLSIGTPTPPELPQCFSRRRPAVPPLPETPTCPRPPPAGPAVPAARGLVEELTRRREADHPDVAIDSVCAELCSAAMQAQHDESEENRPAPEMVLANFSFLKRHEAVGFLSNACRWLSFLLQDPSLGSNVLHASVLLLDRFMAVAQGPVDPSQLHLIMLAVMSTCIKVGGGANDLAKPTILREMLERLCNKQYTAEAIFQVEWQVLFALNCNVAVSSPLDILTSLAAPLGVDSMQSCPAVLARFLLHLSLFDAELLYKYPQSILAAGALYVAFWGARAGPDQLVAFLSDVEMCQGGSPQPKKKNEDIAVQHAMIASAEPLPIGHGPGDVRWQGDAQALPCYQI